MTRYIEDFITTEEREAIERVLKSRDIRFDKLAAMAGLDPKKDFKNSDLRALNFCGADLRGFDFSNSDLRDVVIDANTKIDSTTILLDATVRWINEGDVPIVQIMTEVSHAPGSEARASALTNLEKRFGKTDHVVQFVINAASETDSLDCFLDYLDFLPADLSEGNLERLAVQGERILRRKLSRSRARTRRDATKGFAANRVVERLRQSKDSIAMSWYRKLAETADELDQTEAMKGTVTEPMDKLLVTSLQKLPETARGKT